MNNAVILPFGVTSDGEQVYRVVLKNQHLSCEIITFGATVRTLLVKDRSGQSIDVVLGYDTLEEYESGGCYFGATIGRVANRIANGQFQLSGQSYVLPTNDGSNHHHGGIKGFSHRVWQIEDADCSSVRLSLLSADGDEGYPGNMKVSVQYSLCDNALDIRYTAITDKDTLCSLTNHSYFNLSGHASGTALNQNILIYAHEYTPSQPDGIPFGIIESVDNSPMDLRELLPIQTHINDNHKQLLQAGGYDHNYIINGVAGTLRPAAIAVSDLTGITMRVDTTMPGMHFYTANYINNGCVGKGGSVYGPRHAFCLETQHYPDAIHHPNFPSPVLKAGKMYNHSTRFSFSCL